MIDGRMQTYALTLDKFLKHAAKWHADADVVTARPGELSFRIGYAGLMERSLAVSSKLIKAGMRSGHCVATLAWNTQAHVEAWYAVMGSGAVCHTLNPRIDASTLSAMIQQSGAEILIASEDLLPLALDIASHDNQLLKILLIDCEGENSAGEYPNVQVSKLEDHEPGSDVVTWGNFDEAKASGICFTSGTTGAPKGVTYTHRSTYLHTLRSLQSNMLAIDHTDTILPAVPMFHANAWGVPFAAPAVGARLVLPGRHTDGETLANLICEEKVTVALAVPTVWLGLLQYVEMSGKKLPSLRRIVTGGAPMPSALMERLETNLGITVQTSWGMTELSPAGTFAAPNDKHRSAVNSGRPAIGVDLLLMDAEGTPLAEQRNVEGHLYVKGQAVVERYLGQTEPVTNPEGWFKTGDIAIITEDGQLQITGRSKDLIKSGGEWINPAVMELVVNKLPDISQSAVIARADERWGERPVLIVEMVEGAHLSDDAILSHLRDHVSSWWIPEDVIRLTSIPLAATGKLDKQKLRSQYGIG